MICEKAAAVFLLLTMSAPSYEDGHVEMCFENFDDCRRFEQFFLKELKERASQQLNYRSTHCRSRRTLPK
jgi:hypothetical protein